MKTLRFAPFILILAFFSCHSGDADTNTLTNVSKTRRVFVEEKPIYLNLVNPTSICFWIKSSSETPGSPINLGDYTSGGISVESREEFSVGGFRFRYAAKGPDSGASTGYINDKKWHHVVWYQKGGTVDSEYGLYVDGEKVATKRVPEIRRDRVRFRVTDIDGELSDIRVYNYALSTNEIETIYNKGKLTLQSVLSTYKEFEPIYHWKE